ncbi:hypothetical protein N0V90_004203 [Kalmusia sp. IMI 367209]|nr:hypothetical protein N0V90_004203 [Kalmusia sp. IMI 367209]
MPRGERMEIGEICALEDRVVRVTNLHFKTTDSDVQKLFEGYDVIDWKRDKNVKTGTWSIAYVLLGTLDEVLRAIENLDLKELLGRQLRVMRAKGGFEMTTSGLLGISDGERHVMTPAPQPVPASHSMPDFPPLPGSTEAPPVHRSQLPILRGPRHPPLALVSDAVPARRATTALTPRRRNQRPKPDGPEHRVLLMNKIHPDANQVAVKLFFQGFHVVDFERKYIQRLKRFSNVAFVLFESVQERDRAMRLKNGEKLLGREVELECATRGIQVRETGFVAENEDGIISPPYSTRRVETQQSVGELTPTPTKSASRCCVLASPAVQDSNGTSVDFRPLTAIEEPIQPVYENHLRRQGCGSQQPTYIQAHRGANRDQTPVSPKKQMVRTEQDTVRHVSEIMCEPPAFHHDPLTEILLPTHYQDETRPALGPWNLVGNDSEDKGFNMITEAEWYGFQTAVQKRYYQ